MKTNIFFILTFLLPSISSFAQIQEFVKTESISLPIHKANIGKIVFNSRNVPLKYLQQADFLNTYELTNKSNLFITVFMGNSLTNYLHEMLPGLSHDTVVKKGNFQFSILIDKHLIYRSNLSPGAPYPGIKDTATNLILPLIYYQSEDDLWSQYFWSRFMNNGGDSVLTDGKHFLRMEIRPYMEISGNIKTGDLMASGDLDLIVNRNPDINIAKIQLTPVKSYDGFPVSDESFNHDLIKKLKGKIEEAVFRNISSVVVIKNGKLLIEEYFNGETRNTLHDPRSVGKSFSSTVTGIAENEGYLKNEDQKLKEFYNIPSFANYSPLKENVSIRDLLTMSSVFDGNDDDENSPGNEENMYPTADWVKFSLDLPVSLTRPKEEWHYFTAGVVILGDILNKTVPGGLEKYADEKLFRPLNITDYHWLYTPQNVPNTAGGIRLKALDFAKYGQLYKNEGSWNNKQLIPKEWIHKTFTKQKAVPGRTSDFYGYLFWNKTYLVNNKSCETYYCSGNGGNKIFIFLNQPLVIVITSTAYGKPYAHRQVDKMMMEYILPSVIN